MDVLSDVLRVIRLQGSLFLHAGFGEPWCVAPPGGELLAQVIAPHHEHVAICHLLVEGRCWANVVGGEPVALEAGDVVVMPHGDAHVIGSGRGHTRVSAAEAVPVKVPDLHRLRYGGDGDGTVVVCGWFAYDRDLATTVMAALPRLVRTSIRKRPSGPWLERSILFAVGEAQAGRAGSNVIADRVAEMLFVEALRGYLESLPEGHTGWLAGLRDATVARCIGLLHERPREPWTVASLAKAAGVSRSVLAERFVSLVGTPPMQYLTRWRVALAANLLRSGSLPLTRVAEEVGYESEAAFSRAFKREYGTAPGSWRRGGTSRAVAAP